jgi:hypothetical protein
MIVNAADCAFESPQRLDRRFGTGGLGLIGEVEHERQVVGKDDDLAILAFGDQALGDVFTPLVISDETGSSTMIPPSPSEVATSAKKNASASERCSPSDRISET